MNQWRNSMTDSIWTTGPAGRVERLKKLWVDGLSASAMAKELGCFGHCAKDGRSAVISKVCKILKGST